MPLIQPYNKHNHITYYGRRDVQLIMFTMAETMYVNVDTFEMNKVRILFVSMVLFRFEHVRQRIVCFVQQVHCIQDSIY